MKNLLIAFLFILSGTFAANAQVSRGGFELDSAIIWADTPEDSIKFEKIMDEKYPDAGVFASCMGVLELDMGYTNPEVSIMQFGEQSILYVNICKINKIERYRNKSINVNVLPDCLKNIYSIYKNTIEPNRLYNLMGNLNIKDTSILQKHLAQSKEFYDTHSPDKAPLNSEIIIKVFDDINNAKTCDIDILINYLLYSDSLEYKQIAAYALANKMEDEKVIEAFLINAVNSSQNPICTHFLVNYLETMKDNNLEIKSENLKSTLKTMINTPKFSVIQLLSDIFPKLKNTDKIFGKITKSDLKSIKQMLDLGFNPEPPYQILNPLLGVNFTKNQEFIDYINKMEK